MAWYDDKKALTHVETYNNDKDASKDAERAAQKGWMPQETTASAGHVNAGRTAMKWMIPGGVFFGASRTGGKLTLTYMRTPDWLAANKKR